MELIEKNCIFCGNKSDLVKLYPQSFTEKDLTPEIFSARRKKDHLHYEMVKCKNCGLVFSRRILPETKLKDLYGESTITYNNYASIIAEDYFRHIKKHLPKINKEVALEIGCGNGFFLEKLLEYGFKNIFGVEPSKDAINMANKKIKPHIKQGFFEDGLFEDNTIDFICSFQTLDHLSNPENCIKTIWKILKNNGYVYFITHDIDSIQAKILKDKSPIIDIEHIYLFNKKTLSKLLENNGFKILEIGNVLNSYPIEYWLKMLSINNVFIRILNKIKLTNISIPLQAGNIFTIAKKTN